MFLVLIRGLVYPKASLPSLILPNKTFVQTDLIFTSTPRAPLLSPYCFFFFCNCKAGNKTRGLPGLENSNGSQIIWGQDFSRACCNRDKQTGQGLFIRNWSDRTKGNGLKLKDERFRGDIGKKFFCVKVERN